MGMSLPENAGMPWTRDEEARLIRAFEAGATIAQLARQHGRTLQAIHGRLYRLGKIPAWRPTARPEGEVIFPSRRSCSYVRVRKPKEVRFLSGKIAGVWMVVTLRKPGAYRHENCHISRALRALAEAIERAEVSLADHNTKLQVEA